MNIREILSRVLCCPKKVPYTVQVLSRTQRQNDPKFAGISMADRGVKRAKGYISNFDENGRMDRLKL